jgi:molecular chaperone DnaJ
MNKDYYSVLGVEKTASDEDIKKAYRKLAHRYHPDKPGGDSDKFKEISEAYQILSDRSKRTQYDRFGNVFEGGAAGAGNPFGGFGNVNFDFGDLGDLGDIFEGIFGGAGGARRQVYRRGSDMEISVDISLEDAVKGMKIPLSFNTFIKCESCEGKGFDPAKGFSKCRDCGGSGEVREMKKTFLGEFSRVTACRTCGGAGNIPESPCKTCNGSGRVKGERKIEVEVHPGVMDGQIIKIKGMGESGEKGADTGDLYVRVRVLPHKAFTRRGDDLITFKEVKFSDLLRGEKVSVKTIRGKDIEIGAVPGDSIRKEIRIKGEGVTKKGDLIVFLDLKVPPKVGSKSKKILEDFKDEW